MTIQVVPFLRMHIAPIAADLRDGDWMELRAMGYKTPLHAVRACADNHPHSVAALDAGLPIAAWGYRPDDLLLSDTAYLWCVTTNAVKAHKKEILRLSRGFVDRLQMQYGRLESTVSPIYPQAMRWVEWLGFKPFSEETRNGVRFINMVRER